MPHRRSLDFVEALHDLESGGDVDRIASLFAEDAELSNPTDRQPHRGTRGARHFWENYRRSFAEIGSEFRHIIEADDTAMLEWTGHGRTSDGHEVHYDGVSVLEFRDGEILRFRAYFDPSRLGFQMRHTA